MRHQLQSGDWNVTLAIRENPLTNPARTAFLVSEISDDRRHTGLIS